MSEISTGGEFVPWTEEAKARLDAALFGKTDKPLAWVRADGLLVKTEADMEKGFRHYPLYLHPAPSATEAAVPAELLRNVLLVMETCLSREEGSLADVVIERVRAEVKKLPPLMLAAASPAKQPKGEE